MLWIFYSFNSSTFKDPKWTKARKMRKALSRKKRNARQRRKKVQEAKENMKFIGKKFSTFFPNIGDSPKVKYIFSMQMCYVYLRLLPSAKLPVLLLWKTVGSSMCQAERNEAKFCSEFLNWKPSHPVNCTSSKRR